MRIIEQDAQAQQTQVELTLRLMRAEVVKLTKPGGSFEVQTLTATIGVGGNVLLVQALPYLTHVYCVEGLCSVQNIDPAIPGQVTLHAGESTTVPGGLPPTAPVQTPPAQLQSQIKQTDVGHSTLAAALPGGQGGAAKAPWHIGSLSQGASIGLVLGIGAGAAAGVGIPLASSGKGAAPASPSAP